VRQVDMLFTSVASLQDATVDLRQVVLALGGQKTKKKQGHGDCPEDPTHRVSIRLR